jgi:hypothetical protein
VTGPDLDRFARLDSLGLTVTGQQIFGDHARAVLPGHRRRRTMSWL